MICVNKRKNFYTFVGLYRCISCQKPFRTAVFRQLNGDHTQCFINYMVKINFKQTNNHIDFVKRPVRCNRERRKFEISKIMTDGGILHRDYELELDKGSGDFFCKGKVVRHHRLRHMSRVVERTNFIYHILWVSLSLLPSL